jgi:hypothetical protein
VELARQEIRDLLHVEDRTEQCLIHLSAILGYVPKADSVRGTMILIELVKEVYAAVSASSFGTDIRNLKPNSRAQDIKLGCWLAGRGTKQTDGTVDSSGICLSR